MSQSSDAPCVLVADDSDANRLALKLELADEGFAVEEAGTGSDAITLLGSRKYAAVVTDVWMPGADGIQVIQSIRAVDADVPVFVITGGGPGLSIASVSALAQVWGAHKVYVKPFDVRELVADLKSLVA